MPYTANRAVDGDQGPCYRSAIRRGRRKQAEERPGEKVRINESIRVRELRVIGADGANLGVLDSKEALEKAQEVGLDLIEISPQANPPVAKIMDYGKYQYEVKKRSKEVKQKAHVTETKSVQVKVTTSEHDKELKAKRAAEWLEEGHRVKVDLFLSGRYKYMEPEFLKERLQNFMRLIPAEYKIADPIKKGPKGFTATLEYDSSGKGKSGGKGEGVRSKEETKEVGNVEDKKGTGERTG